MQFEILYLQSTVTVIYSNKFLKNQLFIAFSPAAKCFVPMNFCNNVVWYIFHEFSLNKGYLNFFIFTGIELEFFLTPLRKQCEFNL